jgi:hypothetical protein
MRLLASLLLLVAGAASAQTNGLFTLQCVREADVDAGLVFYNQNTNVITIQGNSWTVSPDGTGIIQQGQLAVAGSFIRMNRFNGAVMARWKPTTPAGAVDFIGVCEVKPRRF